MSNNPQLDDFRVKRFYNGGYAVITTNDDHGYSGERVAAFSGPVDLIQWLSEKLLSNTQPAPAAEHEEAPQ